MGLEYWMGTEAQPASRRTAAVLRMQDGKSEWGGVGGSTSRQVGRLVHDASDIDALTPISLSLPPLALPGCNHRAEHRRASTESGTASAIARNPAGPGCSQSCEYSLRMRS